MRWLDVTSDPNSQQAHGHRRPTLSAAAKPAVPDRLAFLAELARDRRVIDLGVVNHTSESTTTASWLHDRIRSVAGWCLGLDILEEPVRQLHERGYNVRTFDVASGKSLGDKVELIIAGEIIEHLGAPEALFAFAKTHLWPGGRLAITSPHPYYLTRMMMFTRRRDCESVDHVALYFPSAIAELAERAGMRLVEYRGVEVPIRSWRGRLLKRMARTLRWSPELLCDTLIFICEVPK